MGSNQYQEQKPWQRRVGRLVLAQRQLHHLQLAYNEATTALQEVLIKSTTSSQ